MTLAETREQWEKGLEEILVIKDPDENVIVLLQNDIEYYVHRYFQLGEDWQISVDWDDNIELSPFENSYRALKFISDRFKKYIPT